ncbi:MAG: adenylate kinase [Treponema sp.]|nr:adenylate kinase [Treponema sp.]
MNLIFLGSPGAGKGSLAEKAVKELNLAHISTGSIFRSAIAEGSPLGQKVQAIISAGKLVDDETTIDLVRERLSQEDAKKGYILDGFPRTIFQAENMKAFSRVDKVIDLEIPDSLVLERLANRMVCRKCGHNFHMIRNKPKQDGICDLCGGEVFHREDDEETAIKQRLEVYRARTAPLIEYYRKKGMLAVVDASPTIDKVMENFMAVIGR